MPFQNVQIVDNRFLWLDLLKRDNFTEVHCGQKFNLKYFIIQTKHSRPKLIMRVQPCSTSFWTIGLGTAF